MTRSPRRLREQVRDTVSELPIHAARLAVMGVGRALLLTDRVRKDYREARESGLSPVLGRLKNDAENITGMVVGRVSGNGRTEEAPKSSAARDSEISVGKPKPAGTSRPPAPSQRPAARTRPAATPRSKPEAAKPSPAKPTTAKPAASKPAPKAAAKPEPAAPEKPSAQAKPAAKPKPAAQAKPAEQSKAAMAKELPVSGYDEATLASVRARLRGLDTRQVAELRDYERAHAARADFLRMYENRIAKLKSER